MIGLFDGAGAGRAPGRTGGLDEAVTPGEDFDLSLMIGRRRGTGDGRFSNFRYMLTDMTSPPSGGVYVGTECPLPARR